MNILFVCELFGLFLLKNKSLRPIKKHLHFHVYIFSSKGNRIRIKNPTKKCFIKQIRRNYRNR